MSLVAWSLKKLIKKGSTLMASLVNMVNETTGETQKAYTGFSWTALFFGFAIAVLATDPNGIGGSLGLGLIMGFIYNKRHYARLVAKGFAPAAG